MIGLAEANETWSDRIVPALQKFNGLMNTMLHDNHTGYLPQPGDVLSPDDMQWGRVRHQDMLITLQWLLENHPDGQEDLLLDNMKMLHDAGLNWEDFYNEAAYFGQGFDRDLNLLDSNLTEDNFPFEHGVSVAQGFTWASSDTSISINSNTPFPVSPDPETGLHKLSLRKGKTSITYTLPSTIRTVPRANETVAVYKGSLLYALEITNTNTSTPPKPYTNPGFGQEYYNASCAPPESRDWQYHNTSAWNYAIDPSTLTYHGPEEDDVGNELVNPLFAPGAPPGWISAVACEIDWPMAFNDGVVGFPPTGDGKKCTSEKKQVRLVPYANAKTHMAELPVIDLST